LGCVGEFEVWPARTGSIPANATTLFFRVPGVVGGPAKPFGKESVSLTRNGSSELLDFELVGDVSSVTSISPVLLRPTEALEPNSEYTVTIDYLCTPSPASSFKTTNSAPAPTTLALSSRRPPADVSVETPPVTVKLACAPEGDAGDAGDAGASGSGGGTSEPGATTPGGCSFAPAEAESSSGFVTLLALLGLFRRRVSRSKASRARG
jgi:MYXO-CTERM domain-containing protein